MHDPILTVEERSRRKMLWPRFRSEIRLYV